MDRQEESSTFRNTRNVVFNAMVLRAPFSGVENAVLGQAQALVSIRDVRWRFSVLWPQSLTGAEAPSFASKEAVLRTGSRWSSRALRLLWEQLVLPVRLRSLHADILHAPAYLAPLATSCPVVLTVYDLHAIENPERCRTLNRWNYRALLPTSIRCAARIIVPSDHTRDSVVRRFPVVEDRIRVIPLGIHARYTPHPPSMIPPSLAARLPRRFLLCVGNIEPRKNLRLAVEALRMLRNSGYADLGLVVAGRETQSDPAFDHAARSRGLEDSVIRLGYVPESWMPRLYAEAVALVFPSLDEGFGIPPLEAMACGCPVLCADSTALRQTTGGAALYFDPRDARELAITADHVLANPSQRPGWVARALNHAGHYRWSTIIHRVVEVYGEVLQEC